MLTNRPLVVAGTSTVSVEPDMNGNDEVFVTFDGQSGHALQAGDVVEIERAEASAAAGAIGEPQLLRRAAPEVEVGER